MIMQASPAAAATAPGLRDIHLPPAPSWWPPAPGCWLLAALILILLISLGAIVLRRMRQRHRVRLVLNEFDCATAVAANQSAALAAASALLRRAARQHDPAAVQFEGDAWLAYLDGTDATRPFSEGEGRVLVDGMFNRETDTAQATAALRIARARLHEMLMSARLERPHA